MITETVRPTRFFRHEVRMTAAIGLCFAVFAALSLTYVMLLHGGQAGPVRTDFVPYYSAAHLVAAGHGPAIYSRIPMARFEAQLVWPLSVKDGLMPYLYPPFFALLLAPFALLPYVAAFLIWTLINVGLLALSLGLLVRYAGLRGKSALLCWCASLSFLPSLVGLAQGQTSSLLLAVLTGAFLCLRSKRDIAAGMCLALVLIKLPYMLPVLVVLAVQRRWTALTACASASAVLFALPAAVLGPDVLHGYADTLRQAAGWQQQIGGFAPYWNQSIAGFVELLFPAAHTLAVRTALCLAVAGILVHRSRTDGGLDVPFAMSVLAGLLLAPHVLIHDLTVLILPAMLALAIASREHGRSVGFILGAGYIACMVALPLAAFVPVQVVVISMVALLIWFYRPDTASLDCGVRRLRAAFSSLSPSSHSLPMKD